MTNLVEVRALSNFSCNCLGASFRPYKDFKTCTPCLLHPLEQLQRADPFRPHVSIWVVGDRKVGPTHQPKWTHVYFSPACRPIQGPNLSLICVSEDMKQTRTTRAYSFH